MNEDRSQPAATPSGVPTVTSRCNRPNVGAGFCNRHPAGKRPHGECAWDPTTSQFCRALVIRRTTR